MMKRINKTECLTAYLAKYAGRTYDGPDCHNRHPGKGWKWSPSGTATTASPVKRSCWHGSAPTPGTQLPAEIADDAQRWLDVWDCGYILE